MAENLTIFTAKDRREIAQRLSAALLPLIDTRQKQLALSEKTGIPATTIKHWKSGKSLPDIDRFVMLTRAAGFDPAALLAGELAKIPSTPASPTPAAETVRISVLDVRAAAGVGSFNDRALEVEAIDWPRAFLRKVRANPRTTDSLRAAGDSMAPTIETGAFLLVDRSQNELPAPRNGGRPRMPEIFVFVQGKSLRVKRIERIDDNWLALISDNYAMHPPEIVRLGAITIIGKVVWWDNRL